MKSKLLFFLFMTGLLFSGVSNATLYTVTESGCGAGSLAEAVENANLNPGKDRIEFAAGLSSA